MLLCKAPSPTLSNEMKITLKEFEEFNISFINYNYNFVINNSIKEIITIFKGGDYILGKYPEILDFTDKDNLTFTLYGGSKYVNGLTLNIYSTNLDCEENNGVVKCLVSKSHFKDKKSGYYYIYHNNALNGKSKFYEISPFKVIISDISNEKNYSKINIISFLSFLGIILVLL